jgi:hypothetical protein
MAKSEQNHTDEFQKWLDSEVYHAASAQDLARLRVLTEVRRKYSGEPKKHKCVCRDDEFCGREFHHHGSLTETTCCPHCGRQQSPQVIR